VRSENKPPPLPSLSTRARAHTHTPLCCHRCCGTANPPYGQADRLRLRSEAALTTRERPHHAGRWVPWFKLVGSENGFEKSKMGEAWTCCGSRDKGAPGCSKAMLSDLHVPCVRCGTKFYPFELPSNCRFHSGKLSWRDVDPTKLRWECCDRLAAEEGCQSFSKHQQ
jgi:hypothetical protein